MPKVVQISIKSNAINGSDLNIEGFTKVGTPKIFFESNFVDPIPVTLCDYRNERFSC